MTSTTEIPTSEDPSTASLAVEKLAADHLVLDPAAVALLFTQARTANTFSDEPVSRDQLRAITELAKWPPTSANINPLRITFVTTAEGKERLLPLISEGNRAKTESAPVVAILAVDVDFHDRLPQLFPARPEMRDVFTGDPERRAEVARFNGALQTAYFILAVRAAGLAAGPMAGFDAAGVDAEFFPDRSYRSILVVNIGKPGANPWFPRLPRLDHDDYVDYL
ncbi:malonic semialdehyde reductase [Frankia sp. AgPm24]|nr:malonic semialdehyde reductase [Frankia sp. AgPm24]MCK9924005.1 malonic semialdehyde reductase [Frankia sp. AgPm24]